MKLARLFIARALLWLARRVDLSAPAVERADRPPTLWELVLILARLKLARWRLALRIFVNR